jgi:RNA polymerase sigma factor (sigma-70 family)
MDHSGTPAHVSSLTDIELMARVADGDIRQMTHLFRRHHVRLYNFFLRLTGSRQGSEDMVQEVFFRMLKYRHTFHGRGEFTAWMYHLARNVLADQYRKRSKEPPGDGEPDEIPAGSPHALEQMEIDQERDLLEQALARLPGEKREVLVLSRYQELRYDAIAAILGCSVDAVKVRVHRAMNDLRSIFFELSGEKPRE